MNKLSLYLHFPFCKAKCRYCDFYSLPKRELIAPYEKALAKSFSAFSVLAPDARVETVYFGGGTPSLATESGIEEIFSSLRANFTVSEDAEITVEMNPESASEKILSAYHRAGVNRVSFGMQSAIDSELEALGRLHRFEAVRLAVQCARSAGFDNISLDLMYGLPGQTLESFCESLQKALALSPEHVSFYLLTLSESVPLYAQRQFLPGDEAVREMYLTASSCLKENGFEHYEISNAARPGFRSRHNSVYWNGGDYLGIGPGAHSLVDGKRFFVKDGAEEFISAENPLDRLSEFDILTKEDLFTEYLMLSLRTKEGVSTERLKDLSDGETAKCICEKFRLWERHGLCEKTPQGFALTASGFFVSNEIITELM